MSTKNNTNILPSKPSNEKDDPTILPTTDGGTKRDVSALDDANETVNQPNAKIARVEQLSLTVGPIPCSLDGAEFWEPCDGNIIETLLQSNVLRIDKGYNNYGNSSEKQQLSRYFHNYDIKKQAAKVIYEKDSKNIGRVYPKTSLGMTCIRKVIRNTLCLDDWVDVDIVNAHPEMLQQLCIANNITCNELSKYCGNREAYLTEIMTSYQVSRDNAKNLVIRILYGGSFHVWVKRIIETDGKLARKTPTVFIQCLANETINIANIIMEHNPELAKVIETRKSASGKAFKNIAASVASCVLQEYECRILEAVIIYCIDNEYIKDNVAALCFDGFMLPKANYKPELLGALHRLIFQKFGFDLTFVTKSFGENVLEKLYPNDTYQPGCYNGRYRFNDHTKTNDWDQFKLFEQLQVMAKVLTSHKFIPEAIQLMNNVFAFYQGPVRAEIIQRVPIPHSSNKFKMISRTVKNTQEIFQDEIYTVSTGDFSEEKIDGKIIMVEQYAEVNIFKIWIASKQKLKYQEITFNPIDYSKPNAATPQQLNNFTGFDYKPTQRYTKEEMLRLRNNELAIFFNHIEKVWCKYDKDKKISNTEEIAKKKLVQYIERWLACSYVQSWRKIKVAIILKSLPGCGKGTIIEILKLLMGDQYVSEPKALDAITTCEFNSHLLSSCLLMFLDECFYVGDKKIQNALKKVISEETISIGEKYKTQYRIDNLFNIIMASNEDHVAFLQVGQRRNLVVECDATFANDREYFTRLRGIDLQLLANYFYSMEDELNEWNPFDIPDTEDTTDQIIRSFKPDVEVLVNILTDPSILHRFLIEPTENDESGEWQEIDEAMCLGGKYDKKAIYEEIYLKHQRVGRFAKTQAIFWKDTKKLIPGITWDHTKLFANPRNGEFAHDLPKRVYAATFPTLQLAREQLKTSLRLPRLSFE